MNIGKTASSIGVAPTTNNSDDKIGELEQRKKQLTQELKRVKEAAKGGKAGEGEAEKKIKELSDQIKNIEEQIATLKSQKQTASDKTEKASQVQEATKLGKDSISDEALALLPESRRFDEYIKTDDESDKPDITYSVVNEEGKRVIKFNKGNAQSNKSEDSQTYK